MTGFRKSLLYLGLGVVALAGASVAVARGGRGPDRMDGPGLESVMSQLGLDAEQKARIEAIEDRSVKERIELSGKTRWARHELRQLMRAETPDRAAILAKVDEIGRLKTDSKKSKVAARLDQRELLTPAQREQLRTLMAERREARRAERHAARGERGERPERHPRPDGPDGMSGPDDDDFVPEPPEAPEL